MVTVDLTALLETMVLWNGMEWDCDNWIIETNGTNWTDWQKFNIPFGYLLLTISLTIDKQMIILVKEILTI